MSKRIRFGTFRRSLSSVSFTDVFSGEEVRLPRRRLNDVLRHLPGKAPVTGWLFSSTSGEDGAALHTGSLADAFLGPATEMTASELRARSPRATSSPVLDTLLREILMEERIEDEVKIALVGLPWMVANPDSYLNALPLPLHDRLREALRIEARWLDIGQPLREELVTISECLLQPEELVRLRRRRREAEESARAAEERRIQEECERRARAEAERARQAVGERRHGDRREHRG